MDLHRIKFFQCGEWRLVNCFCVLLFLLPVIANGQANTSLQKKGETLDWLIMGGKPGEALIKADSMLEGYEGNNLPAEYYDILFNKAKALEFLYKFVESLQIYNDLLPKVRKSGNYEIEGKIYLSLARIYETLEKKEETKSFLNQSEALIREHQLNSLLINYSVRSSSYHRIYGDKDSSRYFANAGLVYAQKYNDIKLLPDCYLLLGGLEKEKTQKINYFKKSVEAYLQLNNFLSAAYQFYNMARASYRKNDFLSAKNYLDSVNHYISRGIDNDQNRIHDLKYRYSKLKADLFDQENKSDSAAIYYQKSILSRDSADLINLKLSVAKYEVNIAVLNEKEENNHLRVRSNYLIWGLISLSFISILLWFFLRKNTKNNQLIKRKNDVILTQNKELEVISNHQKKLLSEVHHRVKNNLQLVISLMTIKGNSIGDEVFKEAMDDLSSKIQSMSLIHEQLYKVGEFSSIHLDTYIANIVNYFKDILSDDRPIEFILNINKDIKLNLETTLPLGIIIVELIQNSIKHARPDSKVLQIEIILDKKDDSFIFNYSDNGVKFSSDKKGLGSMLIENMGRQLNGIMEKTGGPKFSYQLIFKEKIISPIKFEK